MKEGKEGGRMDYLLNPVQILESRNASNECPSFS